MNLYIHWLKKNWLILALVLLVAVLLFNKSCDEARYERDIAGLNEEIAVKVADNVKKDAIIDKAKNRALKAEAVVVEKEANIEESRIIIADLRRRRSETASEVIALPPSELVKETREILDCAQIQLTTDGVLFSVECTRTVLTVARKFSLMKEELGQTRFSLSESLEATQFQKMATWNVYRIAWAQGTQIMNYRDIVKNQDIKFTKSEQQRKKSFWSGLKLGLAIGAGLTVTITLVIPAIKAIF